MSETNKIATIEDGKLTIDISALINMAQERGPVNIAELAEEVKRILAGHPPPPPDRVEIGPGDDLQAAIDAGGAKIWLKPGTYKPFFVRNGTQIEAIEHGTAVVSGAIPWGDGWAQDGAYWYKPFTTPMHQHAADEVHSVNGKPSARGLLYRKAQQPHLLAFNGVILDPVYSISDLREGSFYLDGTADKPIGIYAMFPFEQAPEAGAVTFGAYQYLIATEKNDVDNVELIGLNLKYCANTGPFGALHVPDSADNWIIEGCTVSHTMGEGIRLQGKNHNVVNCKFLGNGHVGIAAKGLYNSEITGCESSHNAWRTGADPLWHSAALKFQYGCTGNLITDYTSKNNAGSGFWLDISCINNTLDGFTIDECTAFGVHIEHHSAKGTVKNGSIKRTKRVHNGVMYVGSGLQIQGAVTEYNFSNLDIENNSEGSVYLKKTSDPRGNSGNLVFDNIRTSGNGNDNRWIVQGDMDVMPDAYLNIDKPQITNWP